MFEYLGPIEFQKALALQETAFESARLEGPGTIIGFEPVRPVLTFGKRSAAVYVDGFECHKLDRGGQDTIHNPGQLVIFPVLKLGDFSVRSWVELLWWSTRLTLADFGVEANWDEKCPGLYTSKGKILSLGVRVRSQISTHGLAINVRNDLGDFAKIEACGVRGAQMDKIGDGIELREVFKKWQSHFYDGFSHGVS